MSTKRNRWNNTGTTATDNDRLSSLPDSLRLHILSHVPTKYAARTSLLSRKWRDLFLDAPRIALEYSPPLRSRPAGNFNDFDLAGMYSDSDSLGRKHADDAEFLRLTNRRFMLGSLPAPPPPIDEFRLICPTLSKGSSIDVWLANLLRRGIKVVEIEQVDPKSCLGIRSQNPPRNPLANPLLNPPAYLFPPISRKPKGYSLHPPAGFFQSKTLVVLRFRGGTLSFDSSETVFFPNLKVLSLESLTIYVESKKMRFNKLGYPLLEDLELRKLHSGDEVAIEISSQTLKKAAIVSASPRSFTRIDIDAPHLQHLECEDIGRGVSLTECEALESAVLCMCSPAGFNPQAFIETLRNLKRLDVDLKWFPDRVLVVMIPCLNFEI